jgi:hypothetical protein
MRYVLMCAAAAVFISSQVEAQTLKGQLAGIWTYVSSEITLPNGAKQPTAVMRKASLSSMPAGDTLTSRCVLTGLN